VSAIRAAGPQHPPAEIVDLDRYPIADRRRRATRALIADQRQALDRDGVVLLQGFARPAAVARMAAELTTALPQAWRRDRTMLGVHLYEGEAAPPVSHAVNQPNRSRTAILAGDQIPAAGLLWSLFRWNALTDLIAAVVGIERLYRSADPLAALTATALGPGDVHGWHFDENDFVVSLLLQEAETGGRFEVLPDAKTDAGVDFDLCAAALAGAAPGVRAPELHAGTLSIFRGQRSLHRVSPVESGLRLIALFSYDRRPGMMFSTEVHLGAFGRTLPGR
jgi:hypothetical protein